MRKFNFLNPWAASLVGLPNQDLLSPSYGTLVGLRDALCQEQDCSTRIVDFSKNANSNFTLNFFFPNSRNSDSSLLIEINSDFPNFFPQKSRSNFKIRVRLPNMTDWHMLPGIKKYVLIARRRHNIEPP